MAVESIKVPNLGDSKDIEVIEILVKPGQTIKENDSIMVLESDKAAMEIPSPKSGVVKSVSIKLGDQLSEGDEILMLEVEGGTAAAPASTPVAAPAPAAAADWIIACLISSRIACASSLVIPGAPPWPSLSPSLPLPGAPLSSLMCSSSNSPNCFNS